MENEGENVTWSGQRHTTVIHTYSPRFYNGLTRPLPQRQHMAYLRHTGKHSPIRQQRGDF